MDANEKTINQESDSNHTYNRETLVPECLHTETIVQNRIIASLWEEGEILICPFEVTPIDVTYFPAAPKGALALKFADEVDSYRWITDAAELEILKLEGATLTYTALGAVDRVVAYWTPDQDIEKDQPEEVKFFANGDEIGGLTLADVSDRLGSWGDVDEIRDQSGRATHVAQSALVLPLLP